MANESFATRNEADLRKTCDELASMFDRMTPESLTHIERIIVAEALRAYNSKLQSAVQALERCGQCGGLHLPGAPCVVGDDDRVVASSIAASGDERVDDMRHALELDQQAHLEQKLDAIANALGYPVESWRMVGCDVLAHAITDLIGNYRRLESQIAKIDVTLDQLGAPKAAPFAGSEFNVALSRRGRIKRLVQSANAAWIEEELKDGDRICEAAGVQRTEGGRLPVQKIINAIKGRPVIPHRSGGPTDRTDRGSDR